MCYYASEFIKNQKNKMPERFDPTQQITPNGMAAVTARPSAEGARDPMQPFNVQYNPDLVPPEFVVRDGSPSTRGEQVAPDEDPKKVSRRSFLGLAAATTLMVGAAVLTTPKILEKVGEALDHIDVAEVRARSMEMAKSITAAGRSYFSDRLSGTVYPYIDPEQVDPFQVYKEAQNGDIMLAGNFGNTPYFRADSGICLEVYSPERPFDGVARTNLQVMFKDKTGAVQGAVSTARATFENLMSWTESATEPKDLAVPHDPNDPNNALELTRIGIFAVEEDKHPAVASWYVVELSEDAVYVLKPGSDNQGDDDNGMRSKNWLSPDNPEYAAAFRQTIAALEKGIADFTENAKNAR